MKKISLNILINLCCFMGFSQVNRYDNPAQQTYVDQYVPISDETMRQMAIANQRNLQKKRDYFEYCEGEARMCAEKLDFNCITYWYAQSEKTGYHSSSFNYINGLAYHGLGNKRKSVKYLKKSAKEGYYDAVKKLKELYNINYRN